MKFLKDRTFWLMFVLFFLTLFLHDCSGGTFISEAKFSIGFPFAYAHVSEKIVIQEINIIKWALVTNIVLFLIMLRFIHFININYKLRIYTHILIWIHIVFSAGFLIFYFLPFLYRFLALNLSAFALHSFIILLLFLLGVYFLWKSQRLNKELRKVEKRKTALEKRIFLYIGSLMFLISAPFIFVAFLIVFFPLYLITFPFIGILVQTFLFLPTSIIGLSASAIIGLWLSYFIYVLLKKDLQSGNEISEEKSKNKPPLKKKAS